MKRNPLLDSIPVREFDESAVSITDMVNDRGLTRKQAVDLCELNTKTGAWEQVWKHQNKKIVRAWRLSKKRR